MKEEVVEYIEIIIPKLEQAFDKFPANKTEDIEKKINKLQKKSNFSKVVGYNSRVEIGVYISNGGGYIATISGKSVGSAVVSFDIPSKLTSKISDEDNDQFIYPAIREWWESKVDEVRKNDFFDFRIRLEIFSCPREYSYERKYYVYEVDAERRNLFRNELKAFVEEKCYIDYPLKDIEVLRFHESLYMINELGIDKIIKLYLALKKEINFNSREDAVGFYEIIEEAYNSYSNNENPSMKEANNLYHLMKLSTKVLDYKAYDTQPYILDFMKLYEENNFSFDTPLISDMDTILCELNDELQTWIKLEDQTLKRRRSLKVSINQIPLNPMRLSINNIDKNLDLDMFLLAPLSNWNEDTTTKLEKMIRDIIEKNQNIFFEKVHVEFNISSNYLAYDDSYKFDMDVVMQPAYQQWINKNVETLNKGKFESFELLNEDEIKDMVLFLENAEVKVVNEYLNYIWSLKASGKISLIWDFERIIKNRLSSLKEADVYDKQFADKQAAMAIFLLTNGSKSEEIMNFLKMLYSYDNNLAKEYLKDFKEWLDKNYWYDANYKIDQIDNKFIEKLMKAKPKEGMLYKVKSKGYDVILGMQDESKEAYMQVLDYLLTTVPKVAKKAKKNEEYHNVVIFFNEKPKFPDVDIYKEPKVSNAPEQYFGMPRLAELAFFHKALEWEELHDKVSDYAQMLLDGKYTYDYDEFQCLSALPVVTALIMNNRKYFNYYDIYQQQNDNYGDVAQIYMIPGILKKYGVDKETIALINSLASSTDHWIGETYVEFFPELKGILQK